ncbi:MAG: efflux RND transporter periplasmic adaptor subunit [Novosphingobium sp.]|nr:efflux RND transporter periplasmic adaptor subunit [Novosphingobium sp.]
MRKGHGEIWLIPLRLGKIRLRGQGSACEIEAVTAMNYEGKVGTVGEGVESPFDPLAAGGEEERQSNRRTWLIIAIAAAAMIGLWLVQHLFGSEDLSSRATQAPTVTVIVPGRDVIAGRISATGTLAARRELPVGSVGEGGQVVRVLVEPGDWVRAGQILAVIDRSVQVQQQAALAAQVQVAAADARLAQTNLDRALQLVERGFISKADVDRLTATRDVALARVNVARAQLAEMQARMRRLDIVAPAAGLVLERNVEPGQVVGAGTGALFRIAKGGEMELLAEVGEAELAKIAPGQSARVTPVGSEASFAGKVWQVAPVISPQNRQGRVRIALAYAPALRPGGFANAEIDTGNVVAPLLPESALLSDDKGSYVFVVGKDNKVRRRNVKTGMITPAGIVITDGLSGSERIVKRAGAFLSEGESVKPRLVKP